MTDRFVIHGEHPDRGEFVYGNDDDGPFESADAANAWMESQGGPADGFLVTVMRLVPASENAEPSDG